MRVRRVNVGPKTVEVVIQFDEHEPLRTSEIQQVEARALRVLPGLKGHRCDNDGRLPFTHELKDTELAHLLEHVVLEMMALAGSPPTLRGSTAWDFKTDGAGVFHVSVEYDHDLVAIGAVSAAEDIVRWLAQGGRQPDAAAEARRLAGIRKR